jgi:hypothetical protein
MGCDSNHQTTTVREVVQAQATMSAQDFDLQTVTGFFGGGQATDLAALEQRINDPASGINNVDLDKDGQVDPITIRESAANGAPVVEFMAHPTTNPTNEVLVGSINITQQGEQITVQAGYPNYVDGYQNYSYSQVHQGLSFGDAMLLGYLMRPHAFYAPMYVPSRYLARPVVMGSSLGTTRSSYQTTTRVAPVARQALPSTFRQPASAQKAPSQYTAPRATGTIGGNAQQMKDYSQRNTAAPKATGSSFGSGTAPTQRAAPPPSTFSAPTPAPQRSAPPTRSAPPRSSFGGGSRRR